MCTRQTMADGQPCQLGTWTREGVAVDRGKWTALGRVTGLGERPWSTYPKPSHVWLAWDQGQPRVGNAG